MKDEKTIYYLASALFFVVAIMKISDSGFSSGIIWLCLGSAFLCLGANASHSKKDKSEDEDGKKKK